MSEPINKGSRLFLGLTIYSLYFLFTESRRKKADFCHWVGLIHLTVQRAIIYF